MYNLSSQSNQTEESANMARLHFLSRQDLLNIDVAVYKIQETLHSLSSSALP